MKKQLLIAAVAATMTSVAMADISITGGAKVNFVYVDKGASSTAPLTSNDINHDVDFTIKGSNGDTTVSTTVSTTNATDGLVVEDTYLSTKVGDISIKTGAWDNGNNLIRASGRSQGKISVSTSFEGVGVAFDDSEDGNATLKLSGSVSGVSAYFKKGTITDDFGLKTTVGGVTVDYNSMGSDTANSDRDSIRVDGKVSGISLTYAAANADSAVAISGDGWLGNYEGTSAGNGNDVSGFGASMALAGNTVQVKSITVDATNDTDYTKFYVTRKLANGTTFEAIYTDKDVAGSTTSDSETLDLELAVKF